MSNVYKKYSNFKIKSKSLFFILANIVSWAPFTNKDLLKPSMDKWLHQNYLSIPKLQRLHRWSLQIDEYFYPTTYGAGDYLSIFGLMLFHISKGAQHKNAVV